MNLILTSTKNEKGEERREKIYFVLSNMFHIHAMYLGKQKPLVTVKKNRCSTRRKERNEYTNVDLGIP